MYIDTHTRETMEKSICDYLSIEARELLEVFSKAPYINAFLDIDEFVEVIDDFLLQHKPKEQINEILFFHLTRRLISSNDDVTGYNLVNLLTTDNTISSFLKEYQIEFIKEKEHIELYYKKKKIKINEMSGNNALYLRKRLGYNKDKDYCFNGFAFKDILYKNIYAGLLLNGPEFIQKLSEFLKCTALYKDYCQNSKYFCYEYCIPIEKVLFDGNENMSVQQKQKYLLERVIMRLYDYHNNIKYLSDEDNPILRLQDNDMMQGHFFVDKEEIDKTMLM